MTQWHGERRRERRRLRSQGEGHAAHRVRGRARRSRDGGAGAQEEGAEDARLKVTDKRSYLVTELLEREDIDDDYILLGRGYMDETNYKAIEG